MLWRLVLGLGLVAFGYLLGRDAGRAEVLREQEDAVTDRDAAEG
jgi:hypothetical protein